MSDFQVEVLRAAGFLGALALAVSLERLSPHAHLRGDRSVNVSLWLINAVIVGAVCGACACTVARWAARERIGLLSSVGASPWVAIPASVMVLDLLSYAWHRTNHRLPLLWRFHQVHHSDGTFTVSTGTGFDPYRVQWRSDRLEWVIKNGFADWFAEEVRAGRAFFPLSVRS